MPKITIIKNGRKRTVSTRRIGLLPRPPSLSAKARRQQEVIRAKEHAEKNSPEIKALITELGRKLQDSKKSTDRWASAPVLAEIYRTVWELKSLVERDQLSNTILALQGKNYRKDSTPLSPLVMAVCDTADIKYKTANRWRNKLDEAWEDSAQPESIEGRLRRIR